MYYKKLQPTIERERKRQVAYVNHVRPPIHNKKIIMDRGRQKEFSIFSTIPDSHLQSPIRPQERDFLAKTKPRTPKRFKDLKKSCPKPIDLLVTESEAIYGLLLQEAYNINHQLTLEWVKIHVPQSITAAVDVIKRTYESLGVGKITEPNITPDILYWYSLICQWEDIRSLMQGLTGDYNTWKILKKPPKGCEEFWYCGSFAIICIDSRYWLMSYDQIMMITDTILARCNTFILHSMRPDGIPGTLELSALTLLYTIFDSQFRIAGNALFAQIKAWEAIVSGILIMQNDPYPGGKDFLKTILDDAKKEGKELVVQFYELLMSLSLDKHQLAEVYGMFRHFGHPTVDEDSGCRKVTSISKTRPIVSQVVMREITGCIVRQFCTSFITKHGRWPNITSLDTIRHRLLRHLVEKNITYLNMYTANIPVSAWAEITFSTELDMDYFIDYTQLLDDKSLAPEVPDLPSIYDKDLLRYKPRIPRTSRRLLQRAMDVEDIDIREICNMIRNRRIPPEWFIVILHAKEREMKTDPRLFAMMVLEMRLYFCTTEKNIAKKIFPYFPQQTMTMSEAERDNRLLNFTVSQEGVGDKYIHLLKAIDFKSWNLHWSELSTLDICVFLDQIFGTPNLFNFGHEFFSRCVMALASPLNPPDGIESESDPTKIPESARLWRNHQGGLEGIMQKLWTLITIGILLLVEEKTGIRSQIVGQGDNQVCRIAIPKKYPDLSREDYIKVYLEDIETYSKLFDVTLEETCRKIGLVVKTDESLTSSNVLIYGKDIIVEGVYLAQTTKKASRIMPDTNDMYPTLSDSIATTQTSGMSTAQKSHEAVTPFIMGAVSSLLLFTRAVQYPLLPKIKPLDKNHQEMLTSLQSKELLLRLDPNFGGLPFLNPLEFLYRGHPDPLTSYTTFLHLLIKSGDILAKKIWHYLEAEEYEIGDGDSRLLIENPTALNIKKPPLLTTGFRSQLESFIESYPKNKSIKTMMKLSTRDQERELYESLLAHRPLHLRFFHEVSALTIFGARRNFVGTFSSTRTTKKLLVGRARRSALDNEFVEDNLIDMADANRLTHMIKKADIDFLKHLKTLITKIIRSIPSVNNECPTLLARGLRQTSWAPLIKDAPIEGVTIPHPCHQFSITLCASPSHTRCPSNKEFILLTKDPKVEDPRIERGVYPHYVGSKTREKVTGKMLQLPTGSRSLEAAKRASQLKSWCVIPGSSIEILLDDIISTRTNVPHDVLTMASGVISGGSLTHRLRDNITKHETLGGCPPNVTSCYYLSTDTLGRFSRGQDNYNMHFQGAVHMGYACAQITTTLNYEAPNIIHLHYNPCECEERIDDMYIGGTVKTPVLKTLPDNPLIYCNVKDIDIGEVSNMTGIQMVSQGSPARAAATVLLDRIKVKSSNAIWGGSETVRPSVSTLGIKEISRLGITTILRELAVLIILYYDLAPFQRAFFLTTLPLNVWADIVAICLLPDVYKELMQAADIEGVTDAYYNNYSIANAIIRVLRLEISKIIGKSLTTPLTNRTFFLTKNLGITHVMQAWARFVFIASHGKLDIRGPTSEGIKKYHNQGGPMSGDIGIMTCVLEECDRELGLGTALTLLARYPLKLCRVPPETFFGDQLPPRNIKQTNRPYYISSDSTHSSGNYVLRLTVTRPLGSCRWVEPAFSHNPPENTEKTREDHMYRIVGQLSTAWAKILEILYREDVKVCQSAICLAEGEGSIHKLLSNKYGCKTIYNNLLDARKLISHRGVDYRPGCFVDQPEMMVGTDICVQTGGDITRMDTLLAIINSAQASKMIPCGLITCDAEAAGIFSPMLVCKITNALLYVAQKTQAQMIILKVFMHSAEVVAHQLKTAQTLYTQVKLVVPTFSSHEGQEAYLIGKGLRSEYNTLCVFSSETPRYAATPDIQYVVNAVIDLNDARRQLSSVPYQEQRWPYARLLLQSGLTLGFRRNGNTAYEHLLERVCVVQKYDRSTPKKLESYIIQCAATYLASVKNMELAKGMPPEWALGLAKTVSIHNELDRYSRAYINNRAVSIAIEKPKDREQILKEIISMLRTPQVMALPNGQIIYTVSDIDEAQWFKTNIKRLWRVYGSLTLEIDDPQIDNSK